MKTVKRKKLIIISILSLLFVCFGIVAYCFFGNKQNSQSITNIVEKVLSYELDGVDVSHHNGSIDWQLVAKDKRIKFVYAKSSEGLRFHDPRYKENVRKARKAGIKVGAYHYYQEDVDPHAQFKNFKSAVGSDWGDLIPVVDFECIKGNVKSIRKDLKTFCDLIENDCGKKPIIYVGKTYYNQILKGHFDDYFMWADWKWKPVKADFRNLAITQYSISLMKNFPNSTNGVDCNALNVPLESLMLK